MTAGSAIHFESTTAGIAICGRYSPDIIREGTEDIVISKKASPPQRYVSPSVISQDENEVTCKTCKKLLPDWRGVRRDDT